MGRLGELDLPERLARYAPWWVTQLGFGILCTIGAILLRAAVEIVVPNTGPFAFGAPFMLLAALFARWPAGLLTGVLSIGYSWYFLIPYHGSFALQDPADRTRILIAAMVYAVILAFAEMFRIAAHRATAERDRQIAERDLLLEEFDHRVKNNFALVVSLLDLQRRRAADPATAEALGAAGARVESIARAHRHLYRGSAAATGTVRIATYLEELCAALAEAMFQRGGIQLSCTADDAAVPRDRAVSIGLIVNELVTNAAKHAFVGRDRGAIAVTFRGESARWRLTVADDGIGLPDGAPTPGGLGQRLIESFARQAGGTVTSESGAGGTVVTVTLAA